MLSAATSGRQPPLGRYGLFRTGDPAEAQHLVGQSFCQHTLRCMGSHRRLDAAQHRADGRALSISYLRYGAPVSIEPGRLERFYLVQFPLAGSAEVETGRRRLALDAGHGAVLNPEFEGVLRWDADCEMLILRIDRAALTQAAEALVGHSLPGAVVFDATVDRGRPAVAGWIGLLRACVAAAESGPASWSAANSGQSRIEEQLLMRLLACQPSVVSHFLSRTAGQASTTGQIRRARGFIHENLAEPLTLAQIARAAGCGIRSLQVAFRQAFGCSPMQYLHRERLNMAHYLLQTAQDGCIVSQIAYDAGFSHPGRFSTAYRSAFGQSPSRTLETGRSTRSR